MINVTKKTPSNNVCQPVREMWDESAIFYISGHTSHSLASKAPKFSMNNNHLFLYPHTKNQ